MEVSQNGDSLLVGPKEQTILKRRHVEKLPYWFLWLAGSGCLIGLARILVYAHTELYVYCIYIYMYNMICVYIYIYIHICWYSWIRPQLPKHTFQENLLALTTYDVPPHFDLQYLRSIHQPKARCIFSSLKMVDSHGSSC